MFGYAYDFTPDVEQTSIDEGYFDLTGAGTPAVEIALIIRKAISQRLKIIVSEGIGTNKLVSAVASKLKKPAAFQEVPAGGEAAFLQPLPNKWLPGVGPQTSIRLNAAGLAEIRHVASTPLAMLELLLGGQAAAIRKFAHGIDERPLIPEREPQKTFSQQETFPADLTDEEYLEAILLRMADNLFSSVREERRSIRTLTVKVRYNDMAEDQAVKACPNPRIWKPRFIRSSGLCCARPGNAGSACGWSRSSFRIATAARMFRNCPSCPRPARDANARLIGQIDALRKEHGPGIILRAHDLRLRQPPADALAKSVIAPGGGRVRSTPARKAAATYVPLRGHSYYSFLDSTLSRPRSWRWPNSMACRRWP